MNSRGFLSIVGVLIVVVIGAAIISLLMYQHYSSERKVQQQLDAISMPLAPSSSVCSAGDPVDSPGAWCRYVYSANPTQIGDALKRANFIAGTTSTVATSGGNSVVTEYRRGNPALSITLTSYAGSDSRYTGRTTLEARLAQ